MMEGLNDTAEVEEEEVEGPSEEKRASRRQSIESNRAQQAQYGEPRTV